MTTNLNSDYLNLPIDRLNLSIRSRDCLKNMEVETLGDLLEYKKTELLKVPNFGRKSLNEITTVLSLMGITLEEDKNYPYAVSRRVLIRAILEMALHIRAV